MAERSDEIFIYLKAFDSDKTARDIKKVADQLDRLDKSGNAANKSMEDFGNTTEDVSKQHKDLTTEVDKSTKKVEKARDAYSDAEDELKKFAGTTDEFTAKQKLAGKVHGQVTKAIEDDNKAIIKSEKNRYDIGQKLLAQGDANDAKHAENKAKAAAQRQAQELKDLRAHYTALEKEANASRQRETQALGQHAAETFKALDAAEKQTQRMRNLAHTQALRDVDRMAKDEARASANRIKAAENEVKKFERLQQRRKQAWGNLASSFNPGHIIPNLTGNAGQFIAVTALMPMIATGANAAAAGVLALLNGLGQLSGVLGAIPAGMLAAAQGIGVFALAFRGLGKAMSDQWAFDRLGPEAQNLVITLNKLRPELLDIKNGVQDSLLSGLAGQIQGLSKYYLPMLNQQLRKTAAYANTGLRSLAGWMGSREGRSTITGIASTNAFVVGQGVDAGQRLLQTFLLVVNAAGPMLRVMASDIDALSVTIDNWVYNNRSGIGAFFMHGYQMFKGALHTIGDYGTGVYNIIKLASPLTDHILGAITQTGKEFESWTQSGKGVAAIQKYFHDMQPNLDALAHLAGSVATNLFKMGDSKNFVEFVNSLANNAVPAVANALIALGNSGALSLIPSIIASVANVVGTLATLLTPVFKFFDMLPENIREAVVEFALFGILAFKIVGYVKGIAKAIAAMRGIGAVGSIASGGSIAAGGTRVATTVGGATAAEGAAAGALGLLAPAAAAVGSLFVASKLRGANNRYMTGGSGLGSSTDLANVRSGNLNSFFGKFQNINQNAPDLKQYKSGTLANAIADYKYQTTNGWAKAVNGVGGFFGFSTEKSKLQDSFGGLDKSITDLAKHGNVKQAAADFGQLQTQFQIAGLSIDQLNKLFPQYNAFLTQQKNSLNNPGIASTGPGNTARDKNLSYVDSSGRRRSVKPIGGASAYFAGGVAEANMLSTVGELGPELTVDRMGRVGMVGISGMERFMPNRDTAIIPASATSNPLTGDYGNAPEWARKAIQSRLGTTPPASATRAVEGNVTYAPSISIGGTNASEAEIKAAVLAGIKAADRDRRERR